MVFLVTGGAGFIGRWVVKKLLLKGKKVVVIDNLSNGRKENIEEFENEPKFLDLLINDIRNRKEIEDIFQEYNFSVCFHLAAQINVQESLIYPDKSFENNILGTYNILEASRKINTKLVIVGTCMVYDMADSKKTISEIHPLKPTSPYSGSKLAAEELALSYYYGFKLPVIILRPFNVYGPFQKANMEGGVVSIFVNNKINNEKLTIFGDGNQTRDLLYVEDCAEFIIKASEYENSIGEILNAGTGKDLSINDLAMLIVQDENRIEHVKHHHPQSEIMKLVCDYTKAKKLLNWVPKVNLKEGIKKLENWISENKINNDR